MHIFNNNKSCVSYYYRYFCFSGIFFCKNGNIGIIIVNIDSKYFKYLCSETLPFSFTLPILGAHRTGSCIIFI